MKKSLKKFFRKWYVILVIILIVIIGLYAITHRSKQPSYDTATASIGNVIEKVSVTGQIMPVDKVDMAFEKSGVITAINVKVGETVKKGSLIAKLDDAGDLASLQSAQAKLDDISRGLRPEELSSEKSKLDVASTSLSNAKQNAFVEISSAYNEAETAIFNYSDTLFTNPQSINPTIVVQTDSQNKANTIRDERVSVSDSFNNWENDIHTMNKPKDVGDLLNKSEAYSAKIKNFLNDLSGIVNTLAPGNSGLTQTAINAYLASMNSALSGINQSISSLTSASSALDSASVAYNQANDNFSLAKAGSSPEAIRAQAATAASFQAELNKDRIVSPIDGIVTRADPSVGEFVTAGATTFAVQSDKQYKIEAFVPEADIAKVSSQNKADVTLDAYGSSTHFPATVTAIDPAETVLEGVPTYKVTLFFDESDTRIRSGMTANTEILTHEKDAVIVVPTRAVIDNPKSDTTNSDMRSAATKAVRILKSDGKTFTTVPVDVGLKGSDGMTEIISGISVGDKVITYVK